MIMIQPRPARTTDPLPPAPTIDVPLIARLVNAFYARVREDVELGPIFNAIVSDWDHHLRTLTAFWSSVMLSSGDYAGSPMQKHASLSIEGRHFDRWLELFADTARSICTDDVAARFIDRAQRIAESLQWGLRSRSSR